LWHDRLLDKPARDAQFLASLASLRKRKTWNKIYQANFVKIFTQSCIFIIICGKAACDNFRNFGWEKVTDDRGNVQIFVGISLER